ncbi:MAG TPA: hypothetical protein VM122_05525 [Usitatibacter sp.]|nr:hypothetical protein [Usitatibacter sp.]
MALITVYRFKYLDPLSKTLLEARDYATDKAIRELGGVKLENTGIAVDDSRVGRSGILIQDRPTAN